MTFAEAARPTENPEALDYVLRGRAALARPSHSWEDYAEASALLERAVALDPHSVIARAYFAMSLANRAHEDKTDTPQADLERAAELVAEALASSPHHPLVHHAKGTVLAVQGQYGAAVGEFEIALAADPNSVAALGWVGWCRFWTGDIEAGMAAHEQLMCLSPRDGMLGVWQFRIGLGHLLLSQVEEAIPLLERARSAGPQTRWGRVPLAAAYGLAGETERAAAELAEARKLVSVSEGQLSSVARHRAAGFFFRVPGYWGPPKMRALFEATFFQGLRNAGMPEE
jgi:adenylate cyclase